MGKVTFCIYIDNRPDLDETTIRPFIQKEAGRILPIIRQLDTQAKDSSGSSDGLEFHIWYWLVPNRISDKRNPNLSVALSEDEQAVALSEDEQAEETRSQIDSVSKYEKNLQIIENLFDELIRRPSLHSKVVLSNFAKITISNNSSRLFLSEKEINYLSLANSPGDTLDLMKFKAIMYHTDPDFDFDIKTKFGVDKKARYLSEKRNRCNHLLLDSSLIIREYPEFYQTTFGKQKRLQFMINVYSERTPAQFSINNKIMYVPVDDPFASYLCWNYVNRIRVTIGNESRITGGQKKVGKSAEQKQPPLDLYNRVFIQTLHDIGLLHDQLIQFLFDEEADPFLVTRFVNPKREQSWNLHRIINDLGKSLLTTISLDDGKVDWPVFIHLLKKYSAILVPAYSITEHFEHLGRYANLAYDQNAIGDFLRAAHTQYPAETIDFIDQQVKQLNASIENIDTNNPSLLSDLLTELSDRLNAILSELESKPNNRPSESSPTNIDRSHSLNCDDSSSDSDAKKKKLLVELNQFFKKKNLDCDESNPVSAQNHSTTHVNAAEFAHPVYP